ncbi:peptidyl-prolyl cis-trans isomerase [Robertmurraya yapensis]|uniref:Peptidyl-prolyl cis-trans isomerase n=2 Tax=Bacillaceae TaxID=186817 RepID=A0A3S0IVH6_9BACI|nr:peptidyl-prolyl cis-trans isomerase [Bacillus yapensis]RTR32408.1 peptidyl-prolyl cis-trans isomerase [Bacillus yapensis]TKS96602.1 peptidyl-prolyl cis-trans isomerase [Bacillus yapensis]
MESIILISGKVKYSITLDPSVWIFDDRKQELHSFFHDEKEEIDTLEEYTKEVSKHWDREIIEGAIVPPTLKTEKKFIKEELITGTFCIPFKPFLKNAEVHEDARYLIIVSNDGEVKLPLEIAEEMVLGFSKDGKPLREDGPVHCYYRDGSNFNNPIKHVKEFRIE